MALFAHRFVVSCVVALVGACASPCEQRRSWHDEAAQACQSCIQSACGARALALMAVPPDCTPQIACAGRCPDRSGETCGCVETCFTADACRTPFDAYTQCAVAHCDTACR